MQNTRISQAFAAIDRVNSMDPNLDHGEPKELVYSRNMTIWLDHLDPDASEVMQIAARAQHIKRWAIARSDFRLGLEGYRQWRRSLTDLHVNTTAQIMRDAGYSVEEIAQVGSLMRKEQLKVNADSQLLEDVVCLVFLEEYFADFSAKHEPEKVIDILQKTWRKMSSRAQREALKLNIPAAASELVQRAVA